LQRSREEPARRTARSAGMRLGALVAAFGALALLLAGAAATKEGALARLATSVPLDAAPGSTVRIVWTVTIADGKGGRQPFGAGGMFVRFLTRTGAASAPAVGREVQLGRYVAQATVPPGGIGGIRAGLRAWNDYGTANMPIPIENDPFLANGGAHCDVAAVSVALRTFRGALNAGNLRGLDALFSRDRFAWYSSTAPGLRNGSGAQDRSSLVAYFRGRHRRHERVVSLSFRFNSYDAARALGHFTVSGTRRADDFRSGRPFAFAGKGAVDCAKPRVRIAALSLATR